MSPVSVIIPIGPAEPGVPAIVNELVLPKGSQIVLCCEEGREDLALSQVGNGVDVVVSPSGSGRSGLMNAGAKKAKHSWLWFLHADSQPTTDTLRGMERVVVANKTGLYFFDLVFAADGPRAMIVNEWAVRFRAGCLMIPFGDQGFLLPKAMFEQLGGYRQDLPYGEDHVFVWRARQEGYGVNRVGAKLVTSARKYERQGWAQVTGLHVWLTIRQAVPQWLLLQRRRLERLLG